MKNTVSNFESKFTKTDDCWLWTAAVDKDGYGRFRDGSNKVRAHRYSYKLYKGEISDGGLVMHSCDNPRCVNPAHLSIGTPKDNMDDKFSKGRQAKGASIVKDRDYRGDLHPNAKLTASQAAAILADGRVHSAIAKEYGVSRAAVSHLKRGFTWLHLKVQGSGLTA